MKLREIVKLIPNDEDYGNTSVFAYLGDTFTDYKGKKHKREKWICGFGTKKHYPEWFKKFENYEVEKISTYHCSLTYTQEIAIFIKISKKEYMDIWKQFMKETGQDCW